MRQVHNNMQEKHRNIQKDIYERKTIDLNDEPHFYVKHFRMSLTLNFFVILFFCFGLLMLSLLNDINIEKSVFSVKIIYELLE